MFLKKFKQANRKVKQERAYGECLGTVRRRRTQQTAKCSEKWDAHRESVISEWGNPCIRDCADRMLKK